MGRFEGKSAIVTGAASGIGRATAIRIASEGAKVACVDRAADGAEATAAQIRERHTILTTASVAICVAAITWQYLIAGLVIGIAVAVLLLIFRSFADAF